MLPENNELLTALGAVRRGNGWIARCPAHDDKNPSLSLTVSDDGKLLWRCFAGCSQDAVRNALPFPPRASSQRRREVCTYPYQDREGRLLYEVVRYEPKHFLQRQPDGRGGWIGNIRGVERVPYRLPQLIRAIEAGDDVFITEGEKDVNALVELGLTATTFAGGVNGTLPVQWEKYFRGASNVIILPDNDDVGKKYAARLARDLSRVASSVRVLELPGLDLKGDAFAWLSQGGTKDELLSLAASAPEFVAPTTEESAAPSELAGHERRGPRSLSLWTADPSLLAPPVAVVPFLAWNGRTTLLSAREKAGKSTLTAQGVAALSHGVPFLGQAVGSPLTTLWYCVDEPAGDAVRRFLTYGADPERVHLCDERPTAADVEREVAATGASVVVIDTFAELAAGFLESDRDASAVATFLRPYVVAARNSNAALILLHHTTKDGRGYRGSVQLGAGVDAVLTLTQPGTLRVQDGEALDDEPPVDDGRRVLHGKGRGGIVVDLRLSFDGVRYALGDAPLSVRMRLLRQMLDGDASAKELAGLVRARRETVLQEIRLLKRDGYVAGEHGKALTLTPSGRLLALGGVQERNQSGTDERQSVEGVAKMPELAGNLLRMDGNRAGTTREPQRESAVPAHVSIHSHGNRDAAERERMVI